MIPSIIINFKQGEDLEIKSSEECGISRIQTTGSNITIIFECDSRITVKEQMRRWKELTPHAKVIDVYIRKFAIAFDTTIINSTTIKYK